MRTGTWKAAVLLLLAALVGAAAGSALTLRFSGSHEGGHGSARYVALLDRELRLSPAQHDTVQAILQRHRNAMDSLWQEIGPRLDARREAIRSEIRMQLTPEQQQRYAGLTARLDSERKASMRHHDGNDDHSN
jgi:Heavy-metal resistance